MHYVEMSVSKSGADLQKLIVTRAFPPGQRWGPKRGLYLLHVRREQAGRGLLLSQVREGEDQGDRRRSEDCHHFDQACGMSWNPRPVLTHQHRPALGYFSVKIVKSERFLIRRPATAG